MGYLRTILRYSIVILLFTALIAQSFSRSLVLADYMVNVETYKKSCENKAKPMLHCNGKCQMLKKMKKQEGDSGSNATAPKFNEVELVLSSKSFFPSIEFVVSDKLKSFYSYNSAFSSNYIGTVFHPPA